MPYRNNPYQNEWNRLFESVANAGQTIGLTAIETGYKKDTDRQYKRYLSEMESLVNKYSIPDEPTENPKELTNNNIQWENKPSADSLTPEDLNSLAKINAKPVGVDDKGNLTEGYTKRKGIILQKTEEKPDYKGLINALFEKTASLNERGEYGEKKSGNLTDYFDAIVPRKNPQNQKLFGSDGVYYIYDPDTGRVTMLTNNPTEKADAWDTSTPPEAVIEKEGKYYALNYMFNKTTGKRKTIENEITPEEYERWKNKFDKEGYIRPSGTNTGRGRGNSLKLKSPSESAIADKQATTWAYKLLELIATPEDKLTDSEKAKRSTDIEQLTTLLEGRGVKDVPALLDRMKEFPNYDVGTYKQVSEAADKTLQDIGFYDNLKIIQQDLTNGNIDEALQKIGILSSSVDKYMNEAQDLDDNVYLEIYTVINDYYDQLQQMIDGYDYSNVENSVDSDLYSGEPQTP